MSGWLLLSLTKRLNWLPLFHSYDNRWDTDISAHLGFVLSPSFQRVWLPVTPFMLLLRWGWRWLKPSWSTQRETQILEDFVVPWDFVRDPEEKWAWAGVWSCWVQPLPGQSAQPTWHNWKLHRFIWNAVEIQRDAFYIRLC